MIRKDFSDLKIEIQSNKISCYEHENYIAGVPPFLRGNSSTMYLQTPIKSKFIIENNSPTSGNSIIKEKIKLGYNAFTLKFNSKNNNSGILLNSIDDMISLLKDISLDEILFTFNTNNENTIPIIAFFICASKELGFKKELLKFAIQINSENFTNRNTLLNFLKHTINQLPNFESISFSASNYSINGNLQNSLSNYFTTTSSFIQNCISEGIKIDTIASKISFSFELDNNYFYNIAILKASRFLWAKMISEFQPKDQISNALQINIINSKSYLSTLTAILGGAQSIETTIDNSFFIEKETYITKTVDPLGGSSEIEKFTEEIILKTWKEVINKQKNDSFNQINEQVVISNENLLELAIGAAKKRIKLDEIFKLISIKI
ncbi:methylmalonyl-CoA mutase family protein [Lutibacter citreus]|uniref:methylmalonyl-CoA mutase family protein n=1 Tax=Lutibacter citreus TaxID=2138210 RepID=UPI0013003FF1|nr:methylmalonyl-CoA mutase family protein [Lutibacter citreus]